MGLRIPESSRPVENPEGAARAQAAAAVKRSRVEAVAEEQWQWRIGLDLARKAKLDALVGYLAHAIPDRDLDKVFDRMLDEAYEKHGKRLGYLEPERPRPIVEKAPTPGKRARIPLPVRRAVLKRDGYRCTEIGPDGERCCETEGLEMDHLDPANETGSSTVDDLTAKCRPHNLSRARKRYGAAYVQRRIEEARQARATRRAAKAASNQPTLCEPVAPWGAGEVTLASVG
jgi:5-methylcytosine-specific restriction endonuclease McrA